MTRSTFCSQSHTVNARKGPSTVKTATAKGSDTLVTNVYHGQGCLKIVGYEANGTDYIQVTIDPNSTRFADPDMVERSVILYQGPARDFYRRAASITLNPEEK